MNRSPEFQPDISSSIPAPEARGSERFWSRLRSAIPAVVAGVTMAIVLAVEAKVLSQGIPTSGEALSWAALGPAVVISVYGISAAVLDSFSNRSQK